jgi:predicted MFS family arabinose efflux permease
MWPVPLARYREVLRAPGVLGLLFVGFIARGPVIAVSTVLTLHVVLTLHLDFAHAGLLVTALTVSTAVGAPWRGRAVDRLGLRRALLPAIVLGGGVWLVAPFLTYPGLVVAAVVGGVFGLPAFAVIRQALAVAVGSEHRRTTLALDSMSVELSFMTGPAVAVVAATQWSTRGVLVVVGAAQVLAGVAMWVLNPPVRSGSAGAPGAGAGEEAGSRQPDATQEPVEAAAVGGAERRTGRHRVSAAWFTLPLLAVFVSAAGAALVLSASEVAVVAQLRHLQHLSFTGAVFVIWGVTSIVGGFVYGALHREVPPAVVLMLLSLLTLPIGLGTSSLQVALLVGLAGLLCAPALTATSTALTHLVAEESRGVAMGWQGTAMTAGSGLGAPLAGIAADRAGAGSGFVLAGLVGAALALVALVLTRVFRSSPRSPGGRRSGSAPAPRNTEPRRPADSLVD